MNSQPAAQLTVVPVAQDPSNSSCQRSSCTVGGGNSLLLMFTKRDHCRRSSVDRVGLLSLRHRHDCCCDRLPVPQLMLSHCQAARTCETPFKIPQAPQRGHLAETGRADPTGDIAAIVMIALLRVTGVTVASIATGMAMEAARAAVAASEMTDTTAATAATKEDAVAVEKEAQAQAPATPVVTALVAIRVAKEPVALVALSVRGKVAVEDTLLLTFAPLPLPVSLPAPLQAQERG